MSHRTGRVLILIAIVLTVTPTARPQTRQPQAGGTSQPQDTPRPPVTIENLQGAPLLLRLVSAEPAPDKPRLVKLVIQVEAKDATPIKSYSVHFEDEWKDKENGDGNVVMDMNSLNQPPHETEFFARRDGKAIMWVSAVVFADGSEWKSRLNASAKE